MEKELDEGISPAAWVEPRIDNYLTQWWGQEKLLKEIFYNLIPEEWVGVTEENGGSMVGRVAHVEESEEEPSKFIEVQVIW